MIMLMIVVLGSSFHMHRAAEVTDESSQRSASLTDAVAIRGGGTPLGAGLGYAWIVAPVAIDGRRGTIHAGHISMAMPPCTSQEMQRLHQPFGRWPLKRIPAIRAASAQMEP